MTKVLFFDLETTGVDYQKHGIHQLSGKVLIDGVEKENFNFKMQPFPGSVVDEMALKVSGITSSVLSEYPECIDVYLKFKQMLARYIDKFDKNDKFFLAGYNNASFDNAFLRRWFEQHGDKYFGSYFWSNSIDVMVLAAQALLNIRHKMPDFKLMTVAKTIGLEVDNSKLHDALYDIALTIGIYEKLTHA